MPNFLQVLEADEIERLLKAAAELFRFGVPSCESRPVPPGPYPLFYFESEVYRRTKDVLTLARRITVNRRKYTALRREVAPLEAQCERYGRTNPFPQEVGRMMIRCDEVGQMLRFDFETLFHFGSVTLDFWAATMTRLAGIDDALTLHQLVNRLDARPQEPVFAVLHDRFVEPLRWLWLWFRTYRNKFIVHVGAPTQRGHTLGGFEQDIALFTPASVGVTPEARTQELIDSIEQHAPAWLMEQPEDYWERARPLAFLNRVVQNIGEVNVFGDREQIAHVVGQLGIGTPRSQLILSVLATILFEASYAAITQALHDIPAIQL